MIVLCCRSVDILGVITMARKVFCLGWKLSRKVCLLCICPVFIVVFVVNFTTKQPTIYYDKHYFISYWPHNVPHLNDALAERTPLILFWTLFFGYYWDGFYDDFDSKMSVCPYKCAFSHNHTKIDSADLVVFNARDMPSNVKYNGFPTRRSSEQIWMLHNTEPPWFTFLDLRLYGNIFNWTSFVRSDADVPTHYGRIEPIARSNGATAKENPFIIIGPARDFLQLKPNFAVWIASNCYSLNTREDYVTRLQKYISVDTFGACGKSGLCVRNSDDCVRKLKTYKFYLAFENANCRDYITEKLWRAYEYEAIPVVMGRSENYQKYAPPGSYIDSANFSSPAELAAFLLQLSTDSARYNSYFQWRQHYRIVQTYWCDLCTSIHQRNQTHHQVYHDLYDWHTQDTCRPWSFPKKVYINVRYFFNKVMRLIY